MEYPHPLFFFFFFSEIQLPHIIEFIIPIWSYEKTADTEAARGQQGSARLRIEAFKTLRVLVAKVMQ